MPSEQPLIDVLFVLTPRSLLLDLAGPAEAFRLSNQHLKRAGKPARFRLRFTGARSELDSSVGLSLCGLEPYPTTWPAPTWVVLLGQPSEILRNHDHTLTDTANWLARSFAGPLADESPNHRLLTICSGTLLAARAGLLGTRQCTTHHEMLDELRAIAPAAQVGRRCDALAVRM